MWVKEEKMHMVLIGPPRIRRPIGTYLYTDDGEGENGGGAEDPDWSF
jgi:hypothetical protein